MENSQIVAQIIIALRGLFKDKAELKGIDDWDTFVGVLILLEQLGEKLRESEETKQGSEDTWQTDESQT